MSAEARSRIVGIVGLGHMGNALASNLLTRGFEVHVYNRTKEKAESLQAKGAVPHEKAAELAAAADIVITSLTDHKAVEEVALGSNGFLKGMKKGKLWIDMSTIDPDASMRHHRQAAEAGILMLDAPVSGGPALAAKGEVMILVGGSQQLFQEYESFLKELGKTVVYLGPEGSGHKMKLIVNLYMGLVAESFSEALVLSRKLGFESKVFVDTINKTNHKNGFSEGKGPKIAEGKFEATFSLNNLLKDLRLATEQARKNHAVLPVSTAALEQYIEAANNGQGQKDFSAVAIEIGSLNSLTLEKSTP